MNNLISKAAQLYLDGGLSIVPINTRTKRPASWLLPQDLNDAGEPLFWRKLADDTMELTTEPTDIRKGTWKPFQERQPTQGELNAWIDSNVQAYAVVGGMVSGGVEVLDFDVPGYYERWAEIVADDAAMLPLQQTGSGNWQVAYRCPEPEPNQKLAWHPDDSQRSGRVVAIETRGVNGYAVLPPSLHPSGNLYKLVRGRFSQIPTIDQGHRDFLIACAKTLCQAPKTKQEIEAEQHYKTADNREPYEGESVIDAYNAAHRVTTMLEKYGYTRLQNGRYSRPGKTDSAGVIVNPMENKSYHMSSNDILDSESEGGRQPRSPFDFLRVFEFNGDWSKATKFAANELGMIDRRLVERNTQTFFAVMAG